MSTILDLPIELICNVSRELSLDDICNPLLTCTALYKGQLHQYARNRFETVCVILDQQSLWFLLQVVKHPVFAPAVRTLVVCSDHLSDADYINNAQKPPVDEKDNANSDSTGRFNPGKYSERLAGQTSLFKSGRAAKQLSRSLSGFKNCKTIVFSDSDEHDPIGRSRLTDEIGVPPLRSLVVGVDDDHPASVITETEEFVGDAFTTLLLAAARSGLSELHFEVTLGLPYHEEFINAVTSDMLSSLTAREEIRNADFTNITALRLVVYATTRESPMSDIVDFIARFSGLKQLRLHFKNRGDERVSGRYFCQELNVQQLRKLELSRLIFTETQLLDLLLRCNGTLEEVILEQIEFDNNQGWLSFLTKARDERLQCTLILEDCLVEGDFWNEPYRICTLDDYNRAIDDFTEWSAI